MWYLSLSRELGSLVHTGNCVLKWISLMEFGYRYLVSQICWLGRPPRQGSNVSSSQCGERQGGAAQLDHGDRCERSIFNFNFQFNGDRRQRSRDLDGDVVQPPDLPARTLHHPQAGQDCRWKQDPELGHSSSEVPGREQHHHRLPGPVLQGLNN